MFRSIIGKRIKFERQQLGLTQEGLANMIGVTKNCVGAWETGRNLPDIIVLNNLSLIFKVPMEYFFKEDDMTIGEARVPYNTLTSNGINLTDKELMIIYKFRSMHKDKRIALEILLGVR